MCANCIVLPFFFADILDNFLDVADLNQDGYLNYPEYAAAIKLGSAMAEAQESAI